MPGNHALSLSLPNKSNVPTPEQRYSIKPPTEEMDFASNPYPLPALPPDGVYIDRCISSIIFRSRIKIRTPFSKTCHPWEVGGGIKNATSQCRTTEETRGFIHIHIQCNTRSLSCISLNMNISNAI